MDIQIANKSDRTRARSRLHSRTRLLAIAVGIVATLVVGGCLAAGDSGGDALVEASPDAAFTPATTTEVIPAEPFVPDDSFVRDISLALTELAVGTEDAEVSAVFGHPALLIAAQGEVGAMEESIVIFVNEDVHEDAFATEQPTVWLRIDGSDRLEPSNSTLTRGDIHHRTVRFEWDIPGLSPLSELIQEDHRLALLIEPVSPGNTIVWDLPLAFSSGIEAVIEQMNESPIVAPNPAVSIGDSDAITGNDFSEGTTSLLAAINDDEVVTFEINLTETGYEPSAVFVPANQMVQIVFRSSAEGERHFQVPGMTSADIQWIGTRNYEVDVGVTEAEHIAHHEPEFVDWRAPSGSGISPMADEVHAYVDEAGGRDVVRFVAQTPGVYQIVDPLRPAFSGELTVYR